MQFINIEGEGVAICIEGILMIHRTDHESCKVFLHGGHSVELAVSMEDLQAALSGTASEEKQVDFAMDEDLN